MNLQEKISPHMSFYEVIRSQTATRQGINNFPDSSQLENIRQLALYVFEPLRTLICDERGEDTPIRISSFYRSPELNIKIGGSYRSQHCMGRAMDIDVDGMYTDISNFDLFYVIEENLEFDQLIWEFGSDDNPAWVHVSYNEGNNRNEIKRALRDSKGKVTYKTY